MGRGRFFAIQTINCRLRQMIGFAERFVRWRVATKWASALPLLAAAGEMAGRLLMSDRALARLEPGARSSIWPMLRLSLEFLLLFLVALWIANFLVAGTEGAYPNPLWL